MSKDILRRLEALEKRLTPPKDKTKSVTFGARLRDLRQRNDLSQSELIADVGMSKGFLSDLENDKRAPGAEILYRLARRLGVSMDYLWTGV